MGKVKDMRQCIWLVLINLSMFYNGGEKKPDTRFPTLMGKQEQPCWFILTKKTPHIHTNAEHFGKIPMTSPSLLTTSDTLLFSSTDGCCKAPPGHTHTHTHGTTQFHKHSFSRCLGLPFSQHVPLNLHSKHACGCVNVCRVETFNRSWGVTLEKDVTAFTGGFPRRSFSPTLSQSLSP